MRVISIDENGITVHLTRDDAQVVSNALNEVCNALEVREFSIRMGADLNEVRALLKQFVETQKTPP